METVLPEGFRLAAPLDPAYADNLYTRLLRETLSHCTTQKSFGKHGPWFNPMKKMGRFGDPNITYSYKDKKKPVHPWTPALTEIRDLLRQQGHIDANCVVVNVYGDASATLYPHTDSKYIPELGQEPTIVSVSFGATRDFSLVPIANKAYHGAINVPLGHGDILIMSGRSQLDWKHGMAEGPEGVGMRLSLTFRRHHV